MKEVVRLITYTFLFFWPFFLNCLGFLPAVISNFINNNQTARPKTHSNTLLNKSHQSSNKVVRLIWSESSHSGRYVGTTKRVELFRIKLLCFLSGSLVGTKASMRKPQIDRCDTPCIVHVYCVTSYVIFLRPSL